MTQSFKQLNSNFFIYLHIALSQLYNV